MRQRLLCLLLLGAPCVLWSQSSGSPLGAQPPLDRLSFLLGTWTARTVAATSNGAVVTGTCSFSLDLNSHAIRRTSSADACSGPGSLDCNHHDQLTIYSERTERGDDGLRALYLDNEGHVIHYEVSTPSADTVTFLSTGPGNAPRFKLVYHLEGSGRTAVMSGAFQFAAPESNDFHSYLEWTGTRQ